MAASKLFIHIGTQKTGTTTIQNTLSNFSRELRKEGIIYLGKCERIASKNRVARITEADHKLVQKFKSHISESILKKSTSKSNNYVISNEKFTGDKFTGYQNTKVIARLLYQSTKDLNLDVRIVIYIRQQDDFFESTYAERVFKGESYTFQTFLNRFDSSAFHWDDLLKSYAEVFGKGKINVRRYGKHFLPYKDSLINSFGEIINSNFLKTFDKAPLQNTGYRKDTLEFARTVNKLLSNDEVKKMRVVLKEINSKTPYEDYSFFTDQQRKEFLSIYDKSNAWVAREYFNEPSGVLFPPPKLDRNVVSQDGLSPEEIAAILAKSMLLLYNNLEEKTNREPEKVPVHKKLRSKLAAAYRKIRPVVNRRIDI